MYSVEKIICFVIEDRVCAHKLCDQRREIVWLFEVVLCGH